MPRINLTRSLRAEYEQLYTRMEVRAHRFDDTDDVVDRLLVNRKRYERIADEVDAPWYFVAAIHNMEASQRFDRHLHNGDSLRDRTTRMPAGRPRSGVPPFSWEESARDALMIKGIHRVKDWSLAQTLYQLEKYNGWGYRLYHPEVKSPYLWAFSNHYTSGKYIRDGTWSDRVVSRQCGAAVIIRRLEERAEIEPLTGDRSNDIPLYYADTVIDRGADLQRFLNTFEGVALRVDGWPGARTSDAVEKVFAFWLHGDPRP